MSTEDDLMNFEDYKESKKFTWTKCEQNRPGVVAFAVFLCFLASSGYTITLPSMYLFLQDMGVCTATSFWQGIAIGVYCLGQVISANGLGYLANRVNLSWCIGVSLLFDFAGNVIYGMSSNLWILLPGRFLAGIGAGNVALARAYVASVYPAGQRTRAMSMLATAQAIGFIYGPAMGAAVSFIPPFWEDSIFPVNEFTTPAYLAAALGTVAIAVLLLFFRNLPCLQSAENDDTDNLFEDEDEEDKSTIKNKTGLAILLLTFCVVTQVFVLVETTLTPTTAHYFGWVAKAGDEENSCNTSHQHGTSDDGTTNGILYNGLLFLTMGVTAFSTLMLVANIKKIIAKISPRHADSPYLDRAILIAGWVIMLCGCLILFSWDLKITVPRYIIGIELMGPIGYCMAQVTTLSIYSKMLGNTKPGLMMGWITSAGSIARITGPVLSGLLFYWGYLDLVTSVTFDILAVMFALILIFFNRLTPSAQYVYSEFSIQGGAMH